MNLGVHARRADAAAAVSLAVDVEYGLGRVLASTPPASGRDGVDRQGDARVERPGLGGALNKATAHPVGHHRPGPPRTAGVRRQTWESRPPVRPAIPGGAREISVPRLSGLGELP